jgi:thioredoxin-related protein
MQRILSTIPPGSRRFGATLTLALLVALLAQIPALTPAVAEDSRDSSEKRTAKKSESASEANEINWMNYEDGVKLAKEQNKQILIDFSTAWCGYCKKMDRETFTNTSVIEYVNSNFVAIRVDGDSKREFEIDGFSTTEKKLTSEMYGVRGYPTFWFLESDGSKIGKQPGYQPAQGFLELLSFVSERKYLEQAEGASGGKGQ